MDLTKVIKGPYEQACTCGRVGARKVYCKHAENVMLTCNANWKKFLKPWLQMDMWQVHIGPDWDIPTTHQMVQSANDLDDMNMLMHLKQPVISLKAAGAGTHKVSLVNTSPRSLHLYGVCGMSPLVAGRPEKAKNLSAQESERLKKLRGDHENSRCKASTHS